ncbi:hypothetical protein EYF80_033490 [Liparis tanakae]|uniref:Uncharacterized protein n=1 Tax=Liparis tanakae TaxID=230148 RepID=A0A4Z2GUL7_9TELE|nr:hypothetical protein EYF80_033490 [Liparis tanakae]
MDKGDVPRDYALILHGCLSVTMETVHATNSSQKLTVQTSATASCSFLTDSITSRKLSWKLPLPSFTQAACSSLTHLSEQGLPGTYFCFVSSLELLCSLSSGRRTFGGTERQRSTSSASIRSDSCLNRSSRNCCSFRLHSLARDRSRSSASADSPLLSCLTHTFSTTGKISHRLSWKAM